ncbi:MAG: hypothetical protein N2039_07455, partial [Gemmataceae bacterium]|nr:hypothetical protein [Gemmataceae bacterium]
MCTPSKPLHELPDRSRGAVRCLEDRRRRHQDVGTGGNRITPRLQIDSSIHFQLAGRMDCLLYTSDAADER